MRARILAVPLVSALIVAPLLAQRETTVAAALSPPAACSKAAADWRTGQIQAPYDAYRNAKDSAQKADLLAKYSAASRGAMTGYQQALNDCAARFDYATIPVTQLSDLVTLYNAARDTTRSRFATERFLNAKDLPPRAQGQGLLLGMSQEINKDPTHFGIIDGAEAYVVKIDALPDSLADLKLQAHRTMLGRYEYLDVAEGLRKHSTALIALARKQNRPQDMITGYTSLARSYADRLQSDSGLRILDAGEKELGAPATAAFKAFRERYALIGTKASEVTAAWWINTDQKSVLAPTPGKVTLIEFTAHWCGPCKNSYPGLNSLAAKFKGQPFMGVMVTSLYGYIGTQRPLTQEQEIEADKAYFGTEHALQFPVAINPPVAQVAGQFMQPKPDMDYKVGGIPQIMIIDKRGIIRQIVTGWDQGNTERFSKFIEMLLKEPMTSTP